MKIIILIFYWCFFIDQKTKENKLREELIYRELEKNITNKFFSSEKGYEICNKLKFDETSFVLLLLDINDKGIQKVKEDLIKTYTQASYNTEIENEQENTFFPRVIKPNLSETEKEDFLEFIRMICYINSKIEKKALSYKMFLKSLQLNVESLTEKNIYQFLKNQCLPSEEQYLSIIKDLQNRNINDVLKEKLQYAETMIKENSQAEFSLQNDFEEFGLNSKNRDFFEKLSDDLKEMNEQCKKNSENKKLQETSQNNVQSSESENLRKQINLKMQILAIEYYSKINTLIAKRSNCRITENVGELQKQK